MSSSKVILNLSALDYGGAGKFAVDFHNLLLESDYQSYLIVKDSMTNSRNIISYKDNKADSLVGKFCRNVKKRSWTDVNFDYDYYFYNKYERYSTVNAQIILDLLPVSPDVIIIHWVTDFINAKLINELRRLSQARVYWLVIDNAPLTGGCHYPWSCKGFLKGCEDCPAILSESYKWLSVENLAFKKKYIPSDTTLITFSKSDYDRARESSLFRDKRIEKLIGFVDESTFVLGDKTDARSYFNIPAIKKVVFFGATSLKERRKGLQLLLDAMPLVKSPDIHLLIAGKLKDVITDIPATYVGYLSEDELIKAYQAADIFVCPSIEDSGPMMINQSLMCGTPVVAFDVGVAQDLVITGQTGYRARLGDTQDLAQGMTFLLNNEVTEEAVIRVKCHKLAKETYGRTAFTSRLEHLLAI